MHHIQCTVNENKNMNILFHFRQELGTCAECKPTSIAPRFETALREARVGWCSGFITPGRSRPDIFGLKLNGESLTLLNLIGVIPHAHWLASCIKSTRMSHWPSYHNTTVVLCVCTLLRNRLAQEKHWKNEVKVEESASPPPVCLDQRRRHLEIWRRRERKWRVCRIVVTSRYCCGASSGLPPLLCRAAECWRQMSVSLV